MEVSLKFTSDYDSSQSSKQKCTVNNEFQQCLKTFSFEGKLIPIVSQIFQSFQRKGQYYIDDIVEKSKKLNSYMIQLAKDEFIQFQKN